MGVEIKREEKQARLFSKQLVPRTINRVTEVLLSRASYDTLS